MNARFVVTYAARSLRRGGSRSVLAGLCVAFGALSLVSLQLLASAILGVIDVEPRLLIGGDAGLDRGGRPLAVAELDEIDRLRASGEIARSTTVARVPSGALKVVRTGEVYTAKRVLGVMPTEYPLVGTIELDAGVRFASALEEVGHAVVTRDLAAALRLTTGDELLVAGIPGRTPQRVVVAGVAARAPDRRGDSVYVSLETARALVGRDDAATGVAVLWGASSASDALRAGGWSIEDPASVAHDRASVVSLFDFMLEGTGLLGLLIGGVGVSNTMQVLLARRRSEIAALKSIGYGRGHLLALFGAEAVMLGLAGSIAGALAGLAVSWWFVSLFGRLGELLIEWSADPRTLASAVVTGTVTALVFSMRAILAASAVRPVSLLRESPERAARAESVALYAALVGLFAATCSVVLGSATKGAAVAAFGFTGLLALSAVLGSAFWLVVRLPIPAPPLVELARRNLKQQTGRVVVALVALVCGIFTIGFAGATMLDGKARLEARRGSLEGKNLTVYARPDDAPAVTARLVERGARVTPAEDATRPLVAEVPVADLVSVADTLGREFPAAVVVGKHTANAALERALENLFMFVAAVAALALVAGAVLIANAVGLSMIERRREIGVLKAIGYGSRDVLVSLTSEYVLLGALAGVFGLAGVRLAMEAINRTQPQARLSLNLVQAIAILVVSPAIAGLSAWIVARGPSRERPLDVLRSE